MEDVIPVGSRLYWFFLLLLALCRGADFFSTWVATPNLVLEGNPIARKLGWRWGLLLNAVLCATFAMSPLSAIAIATTSGLVAARNFQSAWLMRTLGEEGYRDWYIERLQQTGLPLYLLCLAGQTLPTASVGGVLMYFYEGMLIPFSVGLGIVAYALAVTIYTLLAVWRLRRRAG